MQYMEETDQRVELMKQEKKREREALNKEKARERKRRLTVHEQQEKQVSIIFDPR